VKKELCIVIGTGAVFALSNFAQRVSPSLLWMFLLAASGLALMVECALSALFGVLKWWKVTPWWPAPALLAGLSILTFPFTDRAATLWLNARFRHRLPEYLAVVDGVRSGKIVTSSRLMALPGGMLPPGVLSAQGLHDSDGSVMIIFFTAAAFPLHHEGYLFEDCRGGTNCASELDWLKAKAYLRPMTTNWYHFSG